MPLLGGMGIQIWNFQFGGGVQAAGVDHLQHDRAWFVDIIEPKPEWGGHRLLGLMGWEEFCVTTPALRSVSRLGAEATRQGW